MNLIDFAVTLPGDAHLASMIRDLAEQAARQCGHTEAQTADFGRTVATAVDAACIDASPEGGVTCTLRRDAGSLEVVITNVRGSRTLTLD